MRAVQSLTVLIVVASTFAPASPLAAQSVRCTSQDLGSMTYTSCSDGTRSSTQRIGSTTFYRDSRGNSGATQEIGSFSFTTINGPAGTLRGSSHRIGSTTYGSYSQSETLGSSRRSREAPLPPILPLPEYP